MALDVLNKEIWCTLGPSSMSEPILKRFEELGVTLLRINLSHTPLEDLPAIIRAIRQRTSVPICLDTEGAQVRTCGHPKQELVLEEATLFTLGDACRNETNHALCLYPHGVIAQLEIGDLLNIDFHSVLVNVVQKHPDAVTVRVLQGGRVGKNKAVTVDHTLRLPALTAKDERAILVGRDVGIRHVALSFTHTAQDIATLRSIAGPQTSVTAKIECHAALEHLDEIIAVSDNILIDRGDLSREEPVERIPALQKEIIRHARALGKRTYVATNLLESMTTTMMPTRAEISDVYNTLSDGADGLVLAAETAIGQHPVGSTEMLRRVINEWTRHQLHALPELLVKTHSSGSLILAHGGKLFEHVATAEEQGVAHRLPKLRVSDTVLMDAEQLALATYAPLTGFMDAQTLESVLASYRLPSGLAWTLPILLQISEDDAGSIARATRITLADSQGTPRALLAVREIFQLNKAATAAAWFGTTDLHHPGVRAFLGAGDLCLAGDVTLLSRRDSPYRMYELTARQMRQIFVQKGWSKVVGFHTRNVPHQVHEHLQLSALEQSNADGLLLSPVVGPKKPGDWKTEIILKSYEQLLGAGIYPKGKTVLGAFTTYSRYAGPREAVFTALCRKNMGCSHFIVGRDHTGVENFYTTEQTKRLFATLGDIGIEPIFFDAIGYDQIQRKYTPLTANGSVASISGTQAREAFRKQQRLPEWFMRQEVQELILSEIAANRPVFWSEE